LTKKADQPQLVLVTWRDACTYSGWRDRKTAHKETVPAACLSVGWLLASNKKEVIIYATKALDDEDTDVNSLIAIPASWVEKVEALDVKPRSKRATKQALGYYALSEGAHYIDGEDETPAARRRGRKAHARVILGGVRSWRRGLR
jgi:hypothetical protein